MLAELFTLSAKISLDTQEFESGIDKSKATLNGISANASAAAGALMPVSRGIINIAKDAVSTTMSFDAQMSRVKAISGSTSEEFMQLRDKAKEMGETTMFTATNAGQAFQYMAMAGWKAEDMMEGIGGVMNLAAASGEDLATTSDIVTDALTAFGMSAENSGHFADILAAAATNSNTNVGLMGETFKYVAPMIGTTFRNASEDVEQVARDTAIAVGLMANAGVKGSQAGTSLKNVVTRLVKPTKDSAMAMERLGLSIDDGQGNMYTFRQIMDQMRESFAGVKFDTDAYEQTVAQLNAQLEAGEITQKEYDEALEEQAGTVLKSADAQKGMLAAQLAGSYGLSGLLAIVSASDEDYNKLAAAIDGASDSQDGFNGSAEAMADTMLDNLSGSMTYLNSQLEKLKISFGEMLTPILNDAVSWIRKIVDGLNQMDEGQRKIILVIGAVVGVAGPLLSGIGKISMGISGLIGLFGHFPAIGSMVTGVIGGIKAGLSGLFALITAHPIIAVVTAIVGVIIWLWNTNEGFRNAVKAIWNNIVGFFKNAASAIQTAFKNIPQFFGNIWKNVTNVFANVGSWFSEKFRSAVEAIKSVFRIDWGQIGRNIVEGIGNGLSSMKNWVVDKAKSIGANIWNGFKSFFGINSPSRLMIQTAKHIPEGVAKGIEDNLGMVERAVAGMNETVSVDTGSGTGQTFEVPRSTGRDLTVILELDRMQLGRAVYRLNDEETQRVGVRLAGGFA